MGRGSSGWWDSSASPPRTSRAQHPEGSLEGPALFGLGGLAPEANSYGCVSTNSLTELMRPRF